MRAEIRRLVAKFDIAENHAPGKFQNLTSERHINYFKELFAAQAQKLWRVFFLLTK